MIKKKWEKPKLIILTRGEPEERLLGLCKSHAPGGGPAGDEYGCHIVGFMGWLGCADASPS